MNISEFLEKNMEILTVYLNLDSGHEPFLAVHMTVPPPAIPMFGPPPKRPKKKSLSETISNAAIAITKAISPPSTVNLPTNQSFVISPCKSVDLHMKNLQQLCFIQQLFDDNILSQEEFMEQKGRILDALCKLN